MYSTLHTHTNALIKLPTILSLLLLLLLLLLLSYTPKRRKDRVLQQNKQQQKRDTYNNQLNKCQSIAKGRDAPSTIPKHLHLVRDPLTHNIVARRMAKDNLARIHAPTSQPESHQDASKRIQTIN